MIKIRKLANALNSMVVLSGSLPTRPSRGEREVKEAALAMTVHGKLPRFENPLWTHEPIVEGRGPPSLETDSAKYLLGLRGRRPSRWCRFMGRFHGFLPRSRTMNPPPPRGEFESSTPFASLRHRFGLISTRCCLIAPRHKSEEPVRCLNREASTSFRPWRQTLRHHTI